MLDGIQIKEEVVGGTHIVLRIYDGEFAGCEFYYDRTAFAEEPNPDGTMNMSFEYVVTNGFVIPVDRVQAFVRFIGDNLFSMLEESMARDATVYHGGIGGTYE